LIFAKIKVKPVIGPAPNNTINRFRIEKVEDQ